MARIALTIAGILCLAGCGHETRAAKPAAPASTPPAAGGDLERARTVIKGWSDALRRSDVDRAVRYFALPSVVAQGAAFKLTTRGQLQIFNAGLPCGARLEGVERAGRYVVGTFKLTERPGKTCDAPGNTARVAFIVRDGRIGEWRQLPSSGASGPPATET